MNTREYNQHGLQRLLAHILLAELSYLCQPTERKNAQEFFDSAGLDLVAEGLGLTPSRIRHRVSEGLDPVQVNDWVKNVRRARKGKNGGSVARRAASLLT